MVAKQDQNLMEVLGLHYNGVNSYLIVNGKEIHKFKTKVFETVATPLYLGNISQKTFQ